MLPGGEKKCIWKIIIAAVSEFFNVGSSSFIKNSKVIIKGSTPTRILETVCGPLIQGDWTAVDGGLRQIWDWIDVL